MLSAVLAATPADSALADSALADSVQSKSALPDSVVLLPEVRVDQARAPSAAQKRAPTAFVTELAMQDAGRAVLSLNDVLVQAAGVRVVDQGGLGAFSTIAVRGAPASHATVLLDGEPLSSAANSVVSLSEVPATAIDRIEIYRGATPMGLGVSGAAGAINLVTLPTTRALDARIGGGSYGTQEGRVRAGVARGGLAFSMNAGSQHSRGDFSFHDDNGTPYNTADDSTSTRLNNGFDAAHAIGALTWTPGAKLEIRARHDWYRKSQGVPGTGVNQALHTQHDLERSIARLEVARAAAGSWPELAARASRRRERSSFHDLENELGYGRWSSEDHFGSERAGFALGWPSLPLGLAARGELDGSRERAQPTNAQDPYPDPPISHRTLGAAAAAIELHALRERVLVRVARRWERITDSFHTLGVAGIRQNLEVTRETDVPEAGARIAPLNWLELRGHARRGVRVPEFAELFGDAGSVRGNPALVPENARTWDAGAAVHGQRGRAIGRIDWAHFESRTEQLILFLPAGRGVKAQNLERTRVAGDEVELHAGYGAHALRVAWTRQHAVDDGHFRPWQGKRLPTLPDTQLDARLGLGFGRWSGYGEVLHLGRNPLDRYNRTWAPARDLVGAGISFAAGAGLRLSLEGRNLGDVRAVDVVGYPLPGRSVYAALESRIPGAP